MKVNFVSAGLGQTPKTLSFYFDEHRVQHSRSQDQGHSHKETESQKKGVSRSDDLNYKQGFRVWVFQRNAQQMALEMCLLRAEALLCSLSTGNVGNFPKSRLNAGDGKRPSGVLCILLFLFACFVFLTKIWLFF